MLISIAWRNLWRNIVRTSVTLVAVAGCLTLMLAMYGMMRAMGDRMLEGLTGTSVGHIQIHEEGFRSKRGTAKTIVDADTVLAAVRATENVVAASGRIYGAAHATLVRGEDDLVRRGEGEDVGSPVVSLMGIEPEQESEVTDLHQKVAEGRWIQDETDVVIGAALAKRIKAQVGDAFLPTVVDETGATRGPWAVSDDVPRVVGIAQTGINELDHRMVFMSRGYLAQLLNMESEVHEIAVRSTRALELEPMVGAIEVSVAEARRSADQDEPFPATAPLALNSDSETTPAPEGEGEPDAGVETAPLIELRLIGVEANLDATAQPEHRSGRLAAGTFIRRSDHIVLSAAVAWSLEVSPGDRIEVRVPVDCGDDLTAEQCPPSLEPFIVAGVMGEGEGSELLDGRFGLVASSTISGNIGALAPSVVGELDDEQRAAVAGLLGDMRGAVLVHDEVLAWYDLSPTIRDMLTMLDAAPMIMLVIFFAGVALVIINTMLMSTFERTREIGLMRALGMGSWRVVAMVLIESALLAVVGVAIGLVAGLGLVGYWSVYGMNMGLFQGEQEFEMLGIIMDPIVWPRLEVRDVLSTTIPVGILTTLAGLWPAIRAARLQPTEALRQD
jgi:ABC-type lipoprotein release transport system permease subunit